MTEEQHSARAASEPKVIMSAVKLDRDGNVVENISFDNVRYEASPNFFAGLKRAAKEGWEEGKQKSSEDRKEG